MDDVSGVIMTAARPERATRGLDIAANRRAAKWSTRELVLRALWETANPLFAWSPRQLWGWRNAMLRLFGASIGRRVRIHPTARIAIPWNLAIGDDTAVGDRAVLYSLGLIYLGAKVTVSQHAHLCAGSHNHRRRDLPLVKPPVIVAKGAWICADAFVGPGVTVGANAIVGARAVALSDVAPWTIVQGNPASLRGPRPPFTDE